MKLFFSKESLALFFPSFTTTVKNLKKKKIKTKNNNLKKFVFYT